MESFRPIWLFVGISVGFLPDICRSKFDKNIVEKCLETNALRRSSPFCRFCRGGVKIVPFLPGGVEKLSKLYSSFWLNIEGLKFHGSRDPRQKRQKQGGAWKSLENNGKLSGNLSERTRQKSDKNTPALIRRLARH